MPAVRDVGARFIAAALLTYRDAGQYTQTLTRAAAAGLLPRPPRTVVQKSGSIRNPSEIHLKPGLE